MKKSRKGTVDTRPITKLAKQVLVAERSARIVMHCELGIYDQIKGSFTFWKTLKVNIMHYTESYHFFDQRHTTQLY